jgi:adenylate cyclase
MKNFEVEFSSDRNIQIQQGQSLLEASLSAGIPHFHVCGGNARCSTCRVLILAGKEQLSTPNEKEKALKDKMHFSDEVRLACQTHVEGDGVRLTRIIRDESDINLYVTTAASFTEMIGTEKEVALCFIDIRDSTHFVATHLPFDVIHIMRKLLNCFYVIIEKNHGRIIDTLGDGLYAVFGLEKEIHESADAALKSGYEILENLEQLNRDYFTKNFDQRINLGISIHTGTVVAGEIRIGKKKQLLVMGYPVNVAARLQNATKELNNNFIISSEALEISGKLLSDYPTSTIYLRGITEPVNVHLLGKPYENGVL